MFYLIGDRVTFKLGRMTHVGKVLAIEGYGCKQNGVDRRNVTIETMLIDLGGKEHHGNVTVPYCNIVGLDALA